MCLGGVAKQVRVWVERPSKGRGACCLALRVPLVDGMQHVGWWATYRWRLLLVLQGCLASCTTGAIMEPPSAAAVVAAWRRSVLVVSPLLACNSMPPCHMSNFVEYTAHR